MAIGPSASARAGPSPQPPIRHANRVFPGSSGRILCLADIRGQHSQLNQLAQEAGACAILHTGDFGFFEPSSFESNNISERTLRHLLTYSPLISTDQRERLASKDTPIDTIRNTVRNSPTLLSEFPLLLSGKLKLSVPVYTIWGACEDVSVLEKLRAGEYDIENLHVIDEATSRTLEIGGVKLRLLGLGGAYVPHKLFDNGDGHATIAGGQGTMWTTALQIGELVDTAQKTYDQTETRLFVSHASPGREGLLAQLGTTLKADLTVSAALHFRYATSWNEFSVQQDAEAYRAKLDKGKNAFDEVWRTVKSQVEPAVDENQKILLEKALSLITKPLSTNTPAAEDAQWKNTWNWNLCDAAFGYLVLDIREGRVSAELKSQGFNYAYRRAAPATTNNAAASTPASALNRLASPAPQGSPAVASAAPLAPPAAHAPVNGVALASAEPSPSPTPAPPAEPAPAPSTNGVNGTTPENLTSPKQSHKKKLSSAERRERKAEKEKANATGGSEAERSGSKPSSPVPASASPVPKSQQALSGKNPKGTPKSNASPALSADPALADSDGAVTSPLVRDAATLSGAKSPIPGARRQPARHPWTLFVNRLPVPVSEDELREVFADHKANITLVKLMFNGNGPTKTQTPSAFVEFQDEDSMHAALNNNSGKIKDRQIGIAIARNRGGGEDPNASSDTGAGSDVANGHSSGPRGAGNSRGGRGGRGRGSGALFTQAIGRSLGQQGSGPRRSSGAGGSDSKPSA